jgi:hypothetical protein
MVDTNPAETPKPKTRKPVSETKRDAAARRVSCKTWLERPAPVRLLSILLRIWTCENGLIPAIQARLLSCYRLKNPITALLNR